MPEKDDYLQNYKPKDAPCHYPECVKCGKNDASFVLVEFGICLKCWMKVKKKIPRCLVIPVGRLLLFDKERNKNAES